MQLIRFIFIAILVLWLIRMLIRLILPMLFGKMANKMSEQANQPQQKQRKPEGSISIDYMPPKQKGGNPDALGDFVDYEEIKK